MIPAHSTHRTGIAHSYWRAEIPLCVYDEDKLISFLRTVRFKAKTPMNIQNVFEQRPLVLLMHDCCRFCICNLIMRSKKKPSIVFVLQLVIMRFRYMVVLYRQTSQSQRWWNQIKFYQKIAIPSILPMSLLRGSYPQRLNKLPRHCNSH